jgi:ParB family chromosome partitioning protein
MSTIVKSLPYRGDVTAAVGAGDTLAFVTAHPEDQPTALYRLDADKLNLQTTALPKGGSALTLIGADYWVGGTDGFLYRCPPKGGPQALGEKLPQQPAALAPVAGERLAVAAGPRLTLHAQKDGKVLQAFDLPDEGTCLSVDATGHWLAIGTAGGSVAVFEAETRDEFVPAESAKLHDGRVTALSFEPDDLRFLSAGTDNKLLSTYARGKLEPEDRGRGNNHTEPVTAIVRGPGRFYTGGRDSTVKAWPKGVGTRPVTLKDGVAKVSTLAVVEIGRKPFLAVVCEDNSFRLFELDDEGKPGDLSRRANDALALAKYELSQSEGSRREAGLKMLAGFGDTASFDLIADQMAKDGDHTLRLLAVNLLGESNHPRVGPLLEKALSHNDDAVRTAAFKALRRLAGETALRPIELALKTKWMDTGLLAVAALGDLAGRDDLAMARLTEAINAPTFDVRRAALFTLEKVTEDASLVALNSTHADLRRLALVRLFQRKLLDDSQVQAALRRREEDTDQAVRQTAFLLSLFTRPKLAATLRKIDPELDRLLADLEGIGPDGTPAAQPKAEPPKPAEPAAEIAGRMETIASKRKRVALDPADYEPLLQATASRSLDTCLRGARGLAVLGDPRAFGLLLQLSREDDAAARAQVCRAMAALDDPRAVNRLRSLLFDADASVRDAAFTALIQIHQSDPLLGAEAGLSAAAEDVRRRGLHSLIAALRANPPKRDDEPGIRLMERALNDAAGGVRGEAFKAALNLKLGGGGADTIRFALRSVHADVRREAFTEVMAQVNEEWAWPLVLEFFNDPDPKLRAEAFEFATKRNKEIDVLHTALASSGRRPSWGSSRSGRSRRRSC